MNRAELIELMLEAVIEKRRAQQISRCMPIADTVTIALDALIAAGD